MNPSKPIDPKAKNILSAARTLLAQRGYAHTTISLVAAQAGVSRGLLHYYFKNKEDMLAEVIEANMGRSVSLMAELFSQSHSAEQLATQICNGVREILRTDPDLFNLFFEAWAVARQNEAVNARIETLYGQFRGAIREGLEGAQKRGIIRPHLDAHRLSAVLTALIDGLGLQMVGEPRLLADESIWQGAIAAITLLLGGSAD